MTATTVEKRILHNLHFGTGETECILVRTVPNETRYSMQGSINLEQYGHACVSEHSNNVYILGIFYIFYGFSLVHQEIPTTMDIENAANTLT
jgi:hypothetical protein